MKLKHFNRTNTKNIRRMAPTVNIRKSGSFSLSTQAVINIKLTAGDFIGLVQDEDNERDWYIIKSNKEEGFSLRSYHNRLQFNTSAIVDLMLKSLEMPDRKSITFLIASEPMMNGESELWAIITSSAKQ